VTLQAALDEFEDRAKQCASLIANAHKEDGKKIPLLPALDRQQITVAAFLNLYIAWESFIEDALTKLMSGGATISGVHPTRYVSPLTQDAAKGMVIGINRYFDYANHDNVRKTINMYFDGGYPFEPHLSAIATDLGDLRTMRNSSAHITTTTQKALEALAQRIFSTPQPGIDLYQLLTATHPSSGGKATVFEEAKSKLLTVAALIAHG
jgi:hypothetical protein